VRAIKPRKAGVVHLSVALRWGSSIWRLINPYAVSRVSCAIVLRPISFYSGSSIAFPLQCVLCFPPRLVEETCCDLDCSLFPATTHLPRQRLPSSRGCQASDTLTPRGQNIRRVSARICRHCRHTGSLFPVPASRQVLRPPP
jgi:hypothetical protein